MFDRIDHCYRAVLGTVAASLVASLARELDEVLADYATFKRAAAVLDFDDLLHSARAVVRDHDLVRRALGERYRYIFVDEFQDTDPVQCEVLFRIASDHPAAAWQDSVPRAGALFLVGDPKQAIYKFRGADVGCYLQAREIIRRRWPDNIVRVTANFRSRPQILGHINRCFEPALSTRMPACPALRRSESMRRRARRRHARQRPKRLPNSARSSSAICMCATSGATPSR